MCLRLLPVLFGATALIVSSPILAVTYHVPGDVPTIQGALQLAQYGDSVVVAPGTYAENLTLGSGIVLRSEAGAEATIVDGRFLGPVVSCSSALNFTIEGLTLRRGYMNAYPGGAGISMNNSRGTIIACVLTNNLAARDGGGIAVVDSWAAIRRSSFRTNSTVVANTVDGGGIFCYRSLLDAEDCVFTDNLAQEGGGIAIVQSSTATIRRCVIARNEATGPGPAGAAIIVAGSMAEITNTTAVLNVTPPDGASIALLAGSYVYERNIVALASGNGLQCSTSPTFCNDVWGSGNLDYAGCASHPSNSSADPQFCDLGELDLRLADSSPCAPAHSPPGCGLIGAFDVGCGPVTVEPATWGQVKAYYGHDAAN